MDIVKAENVMSVELAISRELAYRRKLARLRNQPLNLKPLKVPYSSCQVKHSNPTSKAIITQNHFQSSKASPGSLPHITQNPFSTTAQIQNPFPRPDGFESEKLACSRSESGNSSSNLMHMKVPFSSYQVKPSNPTFKPMIAQNQFHCAQSSQGPPSYRSHFQFQQLSHIRKAIPTPNRFQNQILRPIRYQNPIPRPTQTSFPFPRPIPKQNQNQIQIPSAKPSYTPRPSFSSGSKIKGTVSNQFQKPKKPYPDCVIVHQEGNFYCNICHVLCSGPINLHQHLKGRKHKTQLQLVNSGNKVEVGGERIEVQTTWRCELCDVWCMNEDALQQHFKGKNHIVRFHGVRNENQLRLENGK